MRTLVPSKAHPDQTALTCKKRSSLTGRGRVQLNCISSSVDTNGQIGHTDQLTAFTITTLGQGDAQEQARKRFQPFVRQPTEGTRRNVVRPEACVGGERAKGGTEGVRGEQTQGVVGGVSVVKGVS